MLGSIFMMAYIGWARPFRSNLMNNLEFFNETCICWTSAVMFLITDVVLDAHVKELAGWAMIGITGLIFLVNIGAIFGNAIMNLV